MYTIKASCSECGEVDLTASDITLIVCSKPELSYYAFTYPECHDEVRKPADDHVISLLMSGGVKPQAWEIPAEALEPRGLALTDDDLIDFGLKLSDTDFLSEIAGASIR